MTYNIRFLIPWLVLVIMSLLPACSNQTGELKKERADIITALKYLKPVATSSARNWPNARKTLINDILNIATNIEITSELDLCKGLPQALRLECTIVQLEAIDFATKDSKQLDTMKKGFAKLRLAIGETVIRAAVTDSVTIMFIPINMNQTSTSTDKYHGGFLVQEYKENKTKQEHFVNKPMSLDGKLEILYPKSLIGKHKIEIKARKVEARLENNQLELLIYHHPDILPGKFTHLIGILHTDGQFILNDDYIPLFDAELKAFREMMKHGKLNSEYLTLLSTERYFAFQEFQKHVKPGENAADLFEAEMNRAIQEIKAEEAR